jgi:hypothetical protein
VHLTDLGNYFIALVQVRTLTRAEPRWCHRQRDRGDGQAVVVPPATAQALARIASRAVRLYPRSGVLSPPEPN